MSNISALYVRITHRQTHRPTHRRHAHSDKFDIFKLQNVDFHHNLKFEFFRDANTFSIYTYYYDKVKPLCIDSLPSIIDSILQT